MPYIYDAAVLLVIAVTAFIGWKRGFVRYVIKLVGTIACIIFALIVSDMASGPIYNNIVMPRLEKALTDEMQDYDMSADIRKSMEETGIKLDFTDAELKKILSDSGSLSAAFERNALAKGKSKEEAEKLRVQTEVFFEQDFGTAMLRSAGFDNAAELSDKLDINAAKAFDTVRAFCSKEGVKKGVEYLVRNVVDKMMTTLIRYVLFIVLFVLAEALLAVIFMLAGVFDHLPVLKGANKRLGLMLGIVKGVLYVILAAAILSALCESGAIADSGQFSDSHLLGIPFRFFYKR